LYHKVADNDERRISYLYREGGAVQTVHQFAQPEIPELKLTYNANTVSSLALIEDMEKEDWDVRMIRPHEAWFVVLQIV
jgi:hypothetical protein